MVVLPDIEKAALTPPIVVPELKTRLQIQKGEVVRPPRRRDVALHAASVALVGVLALDCLAFAKVLDGHWSSSGCLCSANG